jgi:uncharacterized membrane protein
MRQKWIDVYRGIAVLFMTVLHFFVNIFPSKSIPFLEYSIKGAISIGDMDLALFLFISGVSTYVSISGKSGKNEDNAIRHTLIRYSKIVLLGLFLDIMLVLFADRVWWVLEAIGLAGILAIFFICFSSPMKLLIILIMGLCYSYIVSIPSAYGIISVFPNGWIFGPFSLSGIVLFGYICGSYASKKNMQALVKVSLLLALAGLIVGNFVVYDRGVGTLPYVLLSSSFCMLLVVVVYWLVEIRKISSGILADLGKSALLVFVLNYPVLILAVRLNLNNSFGIGQSALITIALIGLIVLISKLYCKLESRI